MLLRLANRCSLMHKPSDLLVCLYSATELVDSTRLLGFDLTTETILYGLLPPVGNDPADQSESSVIALDKKLVRGRPLPLRWLPWGTLNSQIANDLPPVGMVQVRCNA